METNPENRNTPEEIMGNVVVVLAKYYYTVAIKTDGSLWVCGWNGYHKSGFVTTEMSKQMES